MMLGIRRRLVTWLGLVALIGTVNGFAHGPVHEQITQLSIEIKAAPHEAELYLKRGELYRYDRDWPAALADYEKAFAIDSTLTGLELGWAKALHQADMPVQAKRKLNRFVKKHPTNDQAWLTRARLNRDLGLCAEAAEDFVRAIALCTDPRPEHYIELAQALADNGAGRIGEAIARLDEGMTKLGPIVTLQLYAIQLEVQQENYPLALQRLDAIARQSARKEKWLMRKADILLAAGERTKARQTYENALLAIELLSKRRRYTKATLALAERISSKLLALSRH